MDIIFARYDDFMDESSFITITINVKSAQKIKKTSSTTIPLFSNLAYEEFVQLLTKHNLSDSVANDIIGLFNKFHMDLIAALPSNAKAAQKLLDVMQIPHRLTYYTKRHLL